MAPYKFFSMVIITIILASSFILILPSPVDGNAGIDPDDDSQYDIISIKILVDLEVMDDIVNN